MSAKEFLTVLIVTDVIEAIANAVAGDYRHVIFWIAAAVMTASVTY